jgi:phi13 family phage major tail protein
MTRPLIGLDSFYYAELLTDDSTGTSYDTPVSITNLVSMSVNFNSDIATFFADDGPADAYSQIGEVDVAIEAADIPAEDLAFLLGMTYNAGTGLVEYDTAAVAPDIAIGFRAQKSNGDYRYVWLLKGRFGVPNMDHQTKEGSVNFQTLTINGKFLARTYDKKVFRRIDTDDPNFVFAGLPSSWFADPDLGAAPSALTVVSVVPAALAVDRAITTDITVEFSADFASIDATTANFTLYDATNDAWVAGSVYVNPLDATEVIFSPTASLANSALHVFNVEAGVRSTAGGQLASQFVSTFTTIAP